MTRTLLIVSIMLVLNCGTKHPSDRHVVDANALTRRYAASRFADWQIHASANGRDCAALVIHAQVIFDDSMIEAMHYGAHAYDTYKGGLKQFSIDHKFRGVAYKDVSGRVWTYDGVTRNETEDDVACH